ncbi:hypothetical protein [Streptomyces sp. bgisy034]|uniref:hypothetical protein n=1 Tax=Streptomyces sp. bgisy034 TaxID=3413774 RepID=UPI003EB927C5
MNDHTLDEQQLEALRPLAAVIEGAIKDTPIRLGTDDWGTMLAAGILVRVAAYMGGVLPPAAEAGDWLMRGTRDLSIPEQAPGADEGDGPGWYEVINPRNATTCIAYVHEDGTLYLPEGEGTLTHEEFVFAAARGRAYRLIRAEDGAPPASPAVEEDAQRTSRRDSINMLLECLTAPERGGLTLPERKALHAKVKAEMREGDTARKLAEQAEELQRAAHETSNRAEAERAEAVRQRKQSDSDALRAEAAVARVRAALTTTFLAGPDAVSVVRADKVRAALDGTTAEG